ncbi:MAG: efflux RND transporter periplasmic adaptor subunit [Verrucomicrobiales bacterium]|nr:efflux RND transporter periplasmic adaptor subunit [Verrucomicrobiales bacterium]
MKTPWDCWGNPPKQLLWAGLLVLLPGLTSCRENAGSPVLPPPAVQVLAVAPTHVPLSQELIGQLDSPQNVEVRARVEAFVEAVLFTEGSTVEKGDRLFALDERPFRERLAAANGMLAEARAALNKSEKDVERLRPLAEKRAIPRQDLDNAIAAVEVNRAGVTSAEARVQTAQLDLGYCDVRAPIRGLIGAKQVSVGDLVGKGQPTLLATVSTLNPIWFYGSVSEVAYLKAEGEVRRTGRQLSEVPVSLVLADGSAFPSPGKFVFIDRAVDSKTGTLRVRAEFANPDGLLRPGMFARVRVDVGQRTNSIVVPERSLVELQGKSFVWVVGSDQKASQRPVTVGDAVSGGILVTAGLAPGEQIIVEGWQKVREGVAVRPITPEDKPQAPAPLPHK